MIELLDTEIAEMSEIESILSQFKHKEEPLSSKTEDNSKAKKVIVKKNYFMNSVTIDLISNTSLNHPIIEERSKSKK